MKALAAGLFLTVLALGGFIGWAMVAGPEHAGEPVALLQVDRQDGATDDASPAPAHGNSSGGPRGEQVVIDVTPPSSAEKLADLLEDSPYGPLPRRARDGRTPAAAYAEGMSEVFDAVPRIAIVLRGLGLDKRLTQEAIGKLPPAVSLAFSAYGVGLDRQAAEARRRGHETILQLPLEPVDYPYNDTGPQTLLVAASQEDNQPRLYWSLARFKGYFAVMNNMGGRYLSEPRAVETLFKELQRRGLAFVGDDRVAGRNLSALAGGIGLGYAHADLEVDRQPDQVSIRKSLARLEQAAKRSGFAIGVANMHPVSIDILGAWARGLGKRGYKLVPVSSAYARRKGN